jgi:hypothetical protein
MSDQRRSSSRKCVPKQHQIPSDKFRSNDHQTTTNSSNKRIRSDSVTSNKLNHKKKKEITHDDDDIEEILPEKKSIEKTG